MTRAIVWFRRDLRLHDHPALTAAIAEADEVIPLFVFDDALLRGRWPAPNRLWFMHGSLASLAASIRERGGRLRFARGRPADVLPRLAHELRADAVYMTRDASPYGRRRDQAVGRALAEANVGVHAKRGLYVHEPDELCTQDGAPFTVYSPYRRAWQARPRRPVIDAPTRIPTPDRLAAEHSTTDLPTLGDLASTVRPPTAATSSNPASPPPGDACSDGSTTASRTTRRPETSSSTGRRPVSRRTSAGACSRRWRSWNARAAPARADGVFAQELVWRDFYAHVLWHHPDVLERPFRREFDAPALA